MFRYFFQKSDDEYLASVKEDGMNIRNIPPERRTADICLAATQQNEKAINFVPKNFQLSIVKECPGAFYSLPENMRTYDMYLAAIQKNFRLITLIPKKWLTDEMYSAALKDNVIALEYFPKEISIAVIDKIVLPLLEQKKISFLSIPIHMRTSSIYLEAIKENIISYSNDFSNDKISFSQIPKSMLTDSIYLAAIRQSPDALKFFPESGQINNSEIESAVISYIQQDQVSLKNIPKSICTPSICLAAVRHNLKAFEFVSDSMQNEIINNLTSVVISDIQQNKILLSGVPDNMRIPSICLAAVRQDLKELEFVPDSMKKEIMNTIMREDKLTIEYIITNNYLALQYIPQESESIKGEIERVLASVKHIIIADTSSAFNMLHEVRDAQLVYMAKLAEKKEQVVSIFHNKISPDNSVNSLSQLLVHLKAANNTNSLHLALIGHGSSFDNLDVQTISNVYANNPNIKDIDLVSCNAVNAKKTKKEIEMVDSFVQKTQEKEKLKYGLMSAFEASIDDVKLKQKCVKFCQKNNLDGVYILNKKEKDGEYQLFSIKYDKNNQLTTLKEKSIHKIQNMNDFLGKPIRFPKKKDELSPIKGTDNNPLKPNELTSLRDIAYQENRFEKTHPHYEKDKKIYPFLNKMEVEYKDLETSFFKKMVDAIKDNPAITWTINVTGSSKPLHADTLRRTFRAARTHLYSDYTSSLFQSRKPNINMDKVKEDAQHEIKKMKLGSQPEDKTSAKRLTMAVNKVRR